jgi:hypothetical protein
MVPNKANMTGKPCLAVLKNQPLCSDAGFSLPTQGWTRMAAAAKRTQICRHIVATFSALP